jgi:hypothetical protein
MHRSLSRWIVIGCAAALVGCTTMNTVGASAAGQPPLALTQLMRPGDDVRLTLIDGPALELRVVAVDTLAVEGLGPNSARSVRVAADRISMVERRETSVVKTTLLVLGLAVVAHAYILGRGFGKILGTAP